MKRISRAMFKKKLKQIISEAVEEFVDVESIKPVVGMARWVHVSMVGHFKEGVSGLFQQMVISNCVADIIKYCTTINAEQELPAEPNYEVVMWGNDDQKSSYELLREHPTKTNAIEFEFEKLQEGRELCQFLIVLDIDALAIGTEKDKTAKK